MKCGECCPWRGRSLPLVRLFCTTHGYFSGSRAVGLGRPCSGRAPGRTTGLRWRSLWVCARPGRLGSACLTSGRDAPAVRCCANPPACGGVAQVCGTGVSSSRRGTPLVQGRARHLGELAVSARPQVVGWAFGDLDGFEGDVGVHFGGEGAWMFDEGGGLGCCSRRVLPGLTFCWRFALSRLQCRRGSIDSLCPGIGEKVNIALMHRRLGRASF
jgi:hypothetical protein